MNIYSLACDWLSPVGERHLWVSSQLYSSSPDLSETQLSFFFSFSAYFNDQKLSTTLKVIDEKHCNAAYNKSKLILSSGQMCTGGSGTSDTCRGDSGNGLYENYNGVYYVQGIVSFGSSICGSERWPSISTRVTWFVDWIAKFTQWP